MLVVDCFGNELPRNDNTLIGNQDNPNQLNNPLQVKY